MKKNLFDCDRFTLDVSKEIDHLFGNLQTMIESSQPLTNQEKRMIHEAMSSSFHGGS